MMLEKVHGQEKHGQSQNYQRMLKVKAISTYLNSEFPPFYQEDYDNTGLLIGDPESEVHKALVCVDVTEAIIQEAIDNQCQLIISHHPLIFSGLKRISGQTYIERVVSKAIKHDLNIFALHTNLDNHYNGLNHHLARKLDLKNIAILQKKSNTLRKLVTFCPANHADEVRQAIFEAGAGRIGNYDSCSFNTEGEGSFRALDEANPFVGNLNELHFEKETKIEAIYPVYLEKDILAAMSMAHPYEEVAYDILLLGNHDKYAGSGVLGELEHEIAGLEFLQKMKKAFELEVIKFAGDPEKPVKKVAVCGGGGSFLIKDALQAGAGVFITADLKYHDYFMTENRMLIADLGHYESEQFSKDLITQVLMKKFPNFAVLTANVSTNPVKYLY